MRCEEEEDEVRLVGDLGFLRLGRSNGYSSLEPWLRGHPTRRGPTSPAGAGIEEAFRSARFLPLDSRRAFAIHTDRNVRKTRETHDSAVRGFDGWDKTV